jgi:hypothetical protein
VLASVVDNEDLLVGVEVVLQVLEGQGVVEDLTDGQPHFVQESGLIGLTRR